ncbi:NRDE family protein [Pelagibaculum spongiae]|uniref:NRDE family protein n=1 Tax=Pelagibaculum spongiae TaxID=2080658 RepID=A0A2V1H5B8_9GAMM|nr:NRDE family protein [Pelagibaculum spongiae]PVZ72397.1 hypothetical protein DC094_05165 [Pelagibaculum spongiae]
MCLIALSYQQQKGFPLVLLANRDELHQRETSRLAFWPDAPEILGGKDLEAGGSWLAINRNGRFAVLTNLRRPGQTKGPRSRGLIIKDYLTSNLSTEAFVEQLSNDRALYSGFNIVLGDFSTDCQLWYLSSETTPRELAPGNYAISNEVLGDNWPKTEKLKQGMVESLSQELNEKALMALLENRQQAEKSQLPNTGVGEEMEQLLSPIFIANGIYGTRCSTYLAINHKGFLRMREHSWDVQQQLSDNRSVEFLINAEDDSFLCSDALQNNLDCCSID